jgi:hypothetical protein
MSQNDPSSGEQPRKPINGWDSDITDGRKELDWKSAYPLEARKGIRAEMIYLTILFCICVIVIFSIIYEIYAADGSCRVFPEEASGTGNGFSLFLGFIGAWAAGTLGGCCSAIKWMYHIVAKKLWHEDRRLWRLFSPHLSGAVSLIMVFLVSCGLLQIFDKNFAQRPVSIMAFSFLVGYFSDKALAKMADVADTLFGGVKKDK